MILGPVDEIPVVAFQELNLFLDLLHRWLFLPGLENRSFVAYWMIRICGLQWVVSHSRVNEQQVSHRC